LFSGTHDVSLLNIDNGFFEVLATNGDTHLGGEDFDHRVVEYLVKQWKKKSGLDASQEPKAISKLRRAAETAKKALSTQHQVRRPSPPFPPLPFHPPSFPFPNYLTPPVHH